MKPQYYIVTHRESAVMTDLVWASSQAEAIRLVQNGTGDRVGFEIDELRAPTSWTASPETSELSEN